MIWLLLAPLPFALGALILPVGFRRASLVAGAAAHFAAVCYSWSAPATGEGGMLALDPLGHLFVTLISLLFLATAIYFVGYHQKALVSQRIFLASMLALLAALSLVCMSQHLGLLWVALETSSLAATPLIYFRLGPKALEATWKFLLMNSVGIALALLGVFCLALATTTPSPVPGTQQAEGETLGASSSLTVNALISHASQLDPTWLRAAFLLTLVGFGTKMGLAPLHSWKPDVYSEAPPPIAAIFAGGVTLGAFLGILRVYQICAAASLAPFASFWLCLFGLLSIVTAGIFIIHHQDYRRILAYTSVEHMGVLVLAVGLAGLTVSHASNLTPQTTPAYAAMLHALHNTLNKGILFFTVGILWRLYNSNKIADVKGVIHHHPLVGLLLLTGLCATAGLPPFGMFYSEFGILLATIQQHHYFLAAGFTLAMTLVFVALLTALLPMAFGAPSADAPSTPTIPGWKWRQPIMLFPPAALVVLALVLSLAQPPFVTAALQEAAAALTPPALVAQAPVSARTVAPTVALEVHP